MTTAGGTETPDDFSGLLFPILGFRPFAQISQSLVTLVPFLSDPRSSPTSANALLARLRLMILSTVEEEEQVFIVQQKDDMGLETPTPQNV